MVASPRNQRYLHPRSLGAAVFVCEVDKFVLHRDTRHTRLDRIDHSTYLVFGLFQVARGSVATSSLLGP